MRRPLFSAPYIIFIFILFLCLSPSSSFALEDEVHIEINKTTNQLSIFLNDISVYTFPIGTGKDKHLTPEGEFIIITRVKEPWYLPKNIAGGNPRNPLGTRWLGLSIPGTSGYKYGIHGTNNPASIGHNVSQGCIRMHNKDIEWLYRNIPLGTRVVIKSSLSKNKSAP